MNEKLKSLLSHQDSFNCSTNIELSINDLLNVIKAIELDESMAQDEKSSLLLELNEIKDEIELKRLSKKKKPHNRYEHQMNLGIIEKDLGFSLPDCYAQFLEDYPDGSAANEWKLKSCEELLQPNRVNGSKRPFHCVLSEHTEMMQEFCGKGSATNLDLKFGAPSGTPISFWQINKCIAIGDFNGDYMYLDPMENMSVWIFFHDGCQVQRISGSFASWARSVGLELGSKQRSKGASSSDADNQPGLFD